jgi:putative ABC transport system permease protein
MKKSPPSIPHFLLCLIRDKTDHESLIGDYEETFHYFGTTYGYARARMWYWGQVFKALPVFITNSIRWRLVMFKNYFKIAVRNLMRKKFYSFINIFGLAFGMAIAILIALYVQYELSFDAYHKNADRIYRVAFTNSQQDEFAVTHAPLAPVLRREFPDIESAARILKNYNVTVIFNQKRYTEENFYFAEPELFEIFSIELKKGDPETVFEHLNSVLISERTAEKYFGNEEPIGKFITFSSSTKFVVTGVYANFPENSHFIMDFIAPFELIKGNLDSDWENWRYTYTYVLLRNGTDPKELEKKFSSVIDKYKYSGIQIGESSKDTYFLQPLTKIHLFSHINGEIEPNSDIKYIFVLASFAVLLLIIVCINYINLVTAGSWERSREVGIRKVVGARRSQLVKQFFGESVLLTLFAALFSIAIVISVLPSFNGLVERDLGLNTPFLFFLVSLIFFVGLFSGIYPALFMSSLKPVSIIGKKFRSSAKGQLLRNILFTFQFAIFTIFIICNFIIKDQIHYLFNTDVGFAKEQIVTIRIRDRSAWNRVETIKMGLKENPDILMVSASSQLPNYFKWYSDLRYPGDENENHIKTNSGQVDYDFVDLYGIKIIEGRNFSREFPSDAQGAFLVNETLVKALGWENPVGKELIHFGGAVGKIVGVMKDFNYQPLHNPIGPLYFFLRYTEIQYISVKINTAHIPETLVFIGNKMAEFSPGYPFEYSFFDQDFRKTYAAEQKVGNIMAILMGIVFIVTCLGLLGLAVFITEQKRKEIGIRKVLGASISRIIVLLSKDFLKWIVIANAVAWPAAYIAMTKWLQNFAYRVEIAPLVFILSALIALLVASLTVSFRVVKIARANPVESLRYE